MNPNHLDLEDWELLPDQKFLKINTRDSAADSDDGKKKIYSTIYCSDHFICPPPTQSSPPQFVDTTKLSDSQINSEDFPSSEITEKKEGGDGPGPGPDPDPVSQVFFNKPKETQHLDIKVESPRSKGVIMPQIEIEGPFHLDIIGDDDHHAVEPGESDGCQPFNIWKWGFSGVGAICSFGVAAAAFCIIVFSQRNRHIAHDQKLQFPIYSSYSQGKKRPVHHASTIMAVRGGAKVTRARIVCGGYYEAAV